MLNVATLKSQLQGAFEEILPGAFEQAMLCALPSKTAVGSDMAKNFGDTVCDLIAEPLAEALSSAIDYYVKNITIYGTILTTGTPVSQTAIITSPSPITNGKVPNSLGIM